MTATDDYNIAEIEAPEPWCWSVAVYHVDRAYGGPEEGGWWYDCGVRVDEPLAGLDPAKVLPVFFLTREAADAHADHIDLCLGQTVNEGRRPISSVLSEGRYWALVHEGYPPHHYPTVVPHYE